MEWNAKPQTRWDLESLVTFNATTNENPKKLQETDWEFDGDRGGDSVSLYSSVSGTGSGSGVSGSDLGLASSSRSSKSASINSSSAGEVKTPMFMSDGYEPFPDVLNNKIQVAKVRPSSTSALESTVGTSEPPLSLKLGKRAYFKDALAGSNTRTSSASTIPVSFVTSVKRSKSSSQGTPSTHCQVEGCNIDLSSAKDYHRKHRVCESHSKCPKVIVAGVERRFCQQCSRFHGLTEFDEKKRSCRRRLSDHNARRRKPQPDSIQFNSARLSTLLYDRRQPVSIDWSREPLFNNRPNGSWTSETTSGTMFSITKEYILKPDKAEDIAGDPCILDQECTNSIPMHCHDSNCSFPSKVKGTMAEILNQGSEESVISVNVDATQDLHRALSLLSTKSWASCEPKSISFEQPVPASHTGIPQSLLHVMPQGLPEYLRTEHQSTDSQLHASSLHSDSGMYFQEFQPMKAPYECDFYSNQLN
ncbi:hypothetical protein K2173_003300 [Erythroxylum novogranatense]|uniref:SBP-type domain-containing protein n=1 Tax=Erythroxylum novogranatense TaxID=1862640 RepID=A0AAV8SXF1_9ROSI|nr:hypothetical protein K2173_003300 [Erythroxylum novogranatense]